MTKQWTKTDDAALQQLEAEMADDLKALRMSGRMFAERAQARSTPVRVAVPRLPWLGWALSTATAALLVTAGFGVAHLSSAGHAPGNVMATDVAQQKNTAMSDEALLEQINDDLSTRVPAAMQPLATSDASTARASTAQRTE